MKSYLNQEVAVGQETLAMKLALENGVEWRTLSDEAKQAWLLLIYWHSLISTAKPLAN